MIQIKPTSKLLLVVLLTGWIHFTFSQPPSLPHDPRTHFLNRLEQVINASAPDVLPFLLKTRVIQDWLKTSNEFKDLCLRCEFKLAHNDTYTPVTALIESINRTFHHYIHSANTNFLVLESIKSVDPIGFNAYLTQNKVEISSPDFMEHAAKFKATMNQRVRLLDMRTNDSCFEILEESSSSTTFKRVHAYTNTVSRSLYSPSSIPSTVRNEIATEYGPISDVSIDSFTDLFSEKLSTTMYRVGTTVENYQEHYSYKFDDVQILRGTLHRLEVNQTIVFVPSHLICVRYRAFNQKVYVYGKMKRVKLDSRQKAIIHKLYPFLKEIVIEKRSYFKDEHPVGEIFVIMYATILILGKSPAASIKLNEVWGDETLYMRIHILNMLANRQLALLK